MLRQVARAATSCTSLAINTVQSAQSGSCANLLRTFGQIALLGACTVQGVSSACVYYAVHKCVWVAHATNLWELMSVSRLWNPVHLQTYMLSWLQSIMRSYCSILESYMSNFSPLGEPIPGSLRYHPAFSTMLPKFVNDNQLLPCTCHSLYIHSHTHRLHSRWMTFGFFMRFSSAF